jgi:hypothetical protein
MIVGDKGKKLRKFDAGICYAQGAGTTSAVTHRHQQTKV